MNKGKYILLFVVLLLVPAIVNCLLLIPAFMPVVGDAKDWISFWGAYAGSLITGIVAFCVLNRTIEANNKATQDTIAANLKATQDTIEANKQSLYEQFTFSRGVNFREKVTQCLSHLNLDKYTYFYLQLENGVSAELVSKEIMQCYTTIVEDFASFELEYEKRFPQFCKDYRELVKELSFMVAGMSTFVNCIPSKEKDSEGYESKLLMLKAMADNIKDSNKETLEQLFGFAKNLMLSAYTT